MRRPLDLYAQIARAAPATCPATGDMLATGVGGDQTERDLDRGRRHADRRRRAPTSAPESGAVFVLE